MCASDLCLPRTYPYQGIEALNQAFENISKSIKEAGGNCAIKEAARVIDAKA